MTQKELLLKCDALQGNINRMMVTSDIKELREMYEWACKRLSTIHNERYQILADKEQKDKLIHERTKGYYAGAEDAMKDIQRIKKEEFEKGFKAGMKAVIVNIERFLKEITP